jgi:hypothetical protein
MLAMPIATAARTSQGDLRKADWSVKAPHNLAKNPPANDAVWKFIGLVPGRPDLGKLCDFRFVDLRRSGTLSLVVNYDGGGESNCNSISVFDKSGARIEEYDLPDDGYLDTADVKDINGDGHFEFVVDRTVANEFEGSNYGNGNYSHCRACRACSEDWPRVYAWTGMGYTEVSSQYSKYYQRELGSLKKQIAVIDAAEAAAKLPTTPTPIQGVPVEITEAGVVGAGHGGGGFLLVEPYAAATPAPEDAETPDAGDLNCLKAEAAKMERFLKISKDAGIADAIRWANSNDPGEREFAAYDLSDIGTAEALKYEQTLSRDPEHDVAQSAEQELKDWGKPEKPSAFARASQLP